MTNIQDSGFPLVFKVRNDVSGLPEANQADAIPMRVYVRALEGMQKEALVSLKSAGQLHSWRMVSDEGPYLNGTDLAPFPLAFFSAGMQFSLLSTLIQLAAEAGVNLDTIRLTQDNYYTMDGSALQGTMIGGAKPVEVHLSIESDAAPDVIGELVKRAEVLSPAHVLMRDELQNTFSLTFNRQQEPVKDVKPSPSTFADDLDRLFQQVQPDSSAQYLDDIIAKLNAADTVFGVEGGAASSLQAEQKRTLHIHGEAALGENGLMKTAIQLFKPIGSTFHFVSDEIRDAGGGENAPPPLAYLVAGVGFCYMTQLGRYAHITKQQLQSYQIIQDNIFGATVFPFDTHVYLEADESLEVAQKTVSMSERTCFLHAAMRTSQPTQISIELNGESIMVPQ